MKQRIRLSESALHRIIKESVNKIVYDGFMSNMANKFQGAKQGWYQGGNNVEQNDQDASTLTMWVNKAQRVLQDNNPQGALEFVQNFVKAYGKNKQWQKDTYGSTNYNNNY